MSGNVWEWTSSVYNAYPYNREDGREADRGDSTNVRYVLRGGSFSYTTALVLRAADRNRLSPVVESYNIGFRCARS
ncbi:MAG: SUMF1/EgtB/PvdO family nonheme iron enzyme [Anaerolineae bacterium]|nr:SUMF1/EgtB/PvdO family nonheme iron enzyme [Anaerolineae bacterium]